MQRVRAIEPPMGNGVRIRLVMSHTKGSFV